MAEAAIKADHHVFVQELHGLNPVGVRRMQVACKLAARKGAGLVFGLQARRRCDS